MTAGAVSVAVLNATYQPLGQTKLNRAMTLILRGDAVIEEADEKRTVRHKHGEFPWPLVIRMLRYIKVPMRYAPQVWSKAGVLKRDGYACAYCGKPGTTIDHIHPRARGGKDTWENTVAACQKCNSIKADSLLKDTRLTLRITPTVPMRVYISTKK